MTNRPTRAKCPNNANWADDPDRKTHGTEALGVADAPVMPSLVSWSTNTPTVMIEKTAGLVSGQAA